MPPFEACAIRRRLDFPPGQVASYFRQCTSTVVPNAGLLRTRKLAPIVRARSSMMPRPSRPRELSERTKPRPSSFTRTSTPPLPKLPELAVGLMFSGIKPLGERLTSLPFGPSQPGRKAAPAFSLQPQGVALPPHRSAASAILEEHLRETAAFARAIQAAPGLGLRRVADALERNADKLAAA